VTHQWAFFVSLVVGALLVVFAPTGDARIACAIYAVSVAGLFGTSALYHRLNWGPRARRWMRRLDHAMIFVLIAGTYTPFCLLLGGDAGARLLAIAWGGALLGVARAVLWPHAPKALVAVLSVALGWIILPVLPALRASLGGAAVALLAAGGIVYSLGAVVYATRRPDPFPRVFGYHEVFHAMVIVAAVLHFVVAAGAVLAIR
jgi:hemolysin III